MKSLFQIIQFKENAKKDWVTSLGQDKWIQWNKLKLKANYKLHFWQFEWITLKASSWYRPGTPSPKTISHTSIIIIIVKNKIRINSCIAAITYNFTKNNTKIFTKLKLANLTNSQVFKACYFYGLRSFKIFYEDHTILSVTRENVAFMF